MLRQVELERKPNGSLIVVPKEMNEQKIDQQVKLFIEMASYSRFDGQLHISHFRTFHNKQWTLKILEAVIQELIHPSIQLDISEDRAKLLPFFEYQLERHKSMRDEEFQSPQQRNR